MTVIKYRPLGAGSGSVIDPPTVPPELVQVNVNPAGGPVNDEHAPVSVDANPDPVKPTFCPGKALLGLSVICGTTVNPDVTIPPLGLLFRVTVQTPSDVAAGLMMKVPVAVPVVMEQVEETKRLVPNATLDVAVQLLSVSVSPVAVKEIVSPGDPVDGVIDK
jgi:hypothetical protein